ncbi:MAG: 6-phosphogluconolactonase [Gammaproteobacteria bacterium]|nr:MAG: 6-phosphogluconolactonase [Gammaproteobacteria bacterium]
MTEWVALPDADAIAREACSRILHASAERPDPHRPFSLVLAGGTTPLATYRLLARDGDERPDWHLYYGDERCLPPEHPERNSRMVEQTGLTRLVGGHLPIPAELGPETAALRYTGLIMPALPFDLVLLGMGEDGHTASLFPGRQWPAGPVIPVHDAPKPPPERVSLSPTTLQACRHMLILVSGESKREALQAWRRGADLPVARVAACPQATVLAETALLEPAP